MKIYRVCWHMEDDVANYSTLLSGVKVITPQEKFYSSRGAAEKFIVKLKDASEAMGYIHKLRTSLLEMDVNE